MKKKRRKESSLIAGILPLAKRLAELNKQAESLGLFMNDRELLECSCGLTEDVAFDGRLFTFRKNDRSYSDTGMSFKKGPKGAFTCPQCGARLKVKWW